MIWIAPQNSKLSKIFDKYINVFGVHNFATAKFPCKHLKHAAGVMAQGPNSMENKWTWKCTWNKAKTQYVFRIRLGLWCWKSPLFQSENSSGFSYGFSSNISFYWIGPLQYLDNDNDGVADDPVVLRSMVRRNAAMVLFKVNYFAVENKSKISCVSLNSRMRMMRATQVRYRWVTAIKTCMPSRHTQMASRMTVQALPTPMVILMQLLRKSCIWSINTVMSKSTGLG